MKKLEIEILRGIKMKEMKIERKEKWVRINTIEGYEEIRDCYYLSNGDEDKIMNKNTGRMKKIVINAHGYKRVSLRTIEGKTRHCKIHVLKAKAFIYGPNPLGYNVVRHLNDVKTDDRLENLAWGTRSDNVRDSIRNGKFNYKAAARGSKIGGKITGAKNGRKSAKKSSKPVRCLEIGKIFSSTIEASRKLGIPQSSISRCCCGKHKTTGGLHFEFVNKDK